MNHSLHFVFDGAFCASWQRQLRQDENVYLCCQPTAVRYFGAAKTNAQALSIMSLSSPTCPVSPSCSSNTAYDENVLVAPQSISRKIFQDHSQDLAKIFRYHLLPFGRCYGGHLLDYSSVGRTGISKVAVLLVALTALGRIFFLAHYLLDTVVGIGVCLAFHAILCLGIPGLPALGTAEGGYHPFFWPYGPAGRLAVSKWR
jgi:hypothetical protein